MFPDDQSRFNNPSVEASEDTMTSFEAAQALGIKSTTLYTYVSRGLVRRVPGPDGRSKRYLRSDVMRLKVKHQARAGHGAVAADALQWGQPVLDTALTAISPEGPLYRGQSAVSLARRGASLEHTAALLWAAPDQPWPAIRDPGVELAMLHSLLPDQPDPLAPLSLAIPALALRDPERHLMAPAVEWERARRLITHLAAWCALPRGPQAVHEALSASPGVSRVLACALGDARQETAQALELALVLCADHELNASAFTARVCASAQADLYACCAAALAALSGARHGGVWRRIVALMEEAQLRQVPVLSMVQARLGRGEEVPGFGHPLYPSGDPRARPMLARAEVLGGARPRVEAMLAWVDWMRTHGYGEPTLDMGLVALCEALGLEASASACVFAVGRAVGWVAHILEQRTSPGLLRPRARYTGA